MILKQAKYSTEIMKNKIGIIGSGVVGSAVGKGFLHFGFPVVFYDIDIRRIEQMKKEGFVATTDFKEFVSNANIFFIAVPTPDDNGKIDLSIIEDATERLAIACKDRNDFFTVVGKSTIVPFTTEGKIIPILEYYTGKKAGEDFGVCFNPEFLNESHPFEDVVAPDRIIIGELNKKSGDVLYGIYQMFEGKCPIVRTDLRTAEMVKYANNCFNATKISFFNEIKMMCDEIGVDSVMVRKVVQMDRYYAIHPWKHGEQFGGKCLPKDLNAIIYEFNHGHIHDPILLKAVRAVNEQMAHGHEILLPAVVCAHS
jgi:UDPglucose 6-dehydrogenase